MSDQTNLEILPSGLPVPEDDGACDHLSGLTIPDLALRGTHGEIVELSAIQGRLVIYCYPMTGPAEVPLPEGWDAIPGARGCTPQACSFRDHYQELKQLNTQVYGMSTQSTADQLESKERLHLPFDLLSDENLAFTKALNLPLHVVNELSYLKRVTLIFEDGVIIKYFYPVFPPDKNAEEVLAYLR
ncbi:peroxiredoxin [Pedobacter sp. WC2423]|uniref:peroxiredoxin n=1 Tax=Pedobacter sp. WC2423 TaxID=3234142 RepID=UPI003467E229